MQPIDIGKLGMLLGGTVTNLARSGKQDGTKEKWGIVIQTEKQAYTVWLSNDKDPEAFTIERYKQGDEQPNK